MIRLTITCGDINGIGPEISLKAINKIYDPSKRKIAFFCPENIFEKTTALVKPAFDFDIIKKYTSQYLQSNKVIVVDTGKSAQNIGIPTKQSGNIAYKSIIESYKAIQRGFADAIITAPISKTSFRLAGIDFPGQTELLAHLTKTKKYLMMFLSKRMICGLITIHVPIKKVPTIISKKRFRIALDVLSCTLEHDLKIKRPKIAVLGLNPHAGEGGKIGDEERSILNPVIASIKNYHVEGPFVPDAFFGTSAYKKYDAVLGMYHDQVLIPFKMLNFNKGANFTAGIPIVRTSPDHGTGYDIAGIGIANPESMIEATKWAEKILMNRIT